MLLCACYSFCIIGTAILGHASSMAVTIISTFIFVLLGAVISKPYNPNQLREVLKSALEGSLPAHVLEL